MTSFIIKTQANRKPPASWTNLSPDCAFCRIIKDESPAHRVYEDDDVIAILDILPIRTGHTLVIPKTHISRLSELPPDLAAAVGRGVSKVADAMTKALENTALNVVCNQEYAQAVPHVHYHIVPAPNFRTHHGVADTSKSVGHLAPVSHKAMHQKEFEGRLDELDDDEGALIAQAIRSKL